jgi:hypothetical protein
VRGVQPVRHRLLDPGETEDRVLLAQRQDPLQQAALVHHFQGTNAQAERAGPRDRLVLLLEHEHVHAVQPQLGGQHQSGRSAAGNDHVDHENPRQVWLRPPILRLTPGLAARPPLRYMLIVAGSM